MEHAPPAGLAAELAAALGQVSDLKRQLSNCESEVRALEARIGAVDRAAAARVAESEGRVLAIYHSWSWRMTGPMRRLARLARRLLIRG